MGHTVYTPSTRRHHRHVFRIPLYHSNSRQYAVKLVSSVLQAEFGRMSRRIRGCSPRAPFFIKGIELLDRNQNPFLDIPSLPRPRQLETVADIRGALLDLVFEPVVSVVASHLPRGRSLWFEWDTLSDGRRLGYYNRRVTTNSLVLEALSENTLNEQKFLRASTSEADAVAFYTRVKAVLSSRAGHGSSVR